MKLEPKWLLIFRVLVLWVLWVLPVLSAQGQEGPVIESIDGDKIVVVKMAKGSRVAERGSELKVGEWVRTGPRATAKLAYPDGSKLLVAPSSEVEVQESAKGTQFNTLHSGEVRGLIRKPKSVEQAGPPRFIMRSKTAVMGVRGTDFIFNNSDKTALAEVRTLEGAVEVAKDEPTLMAGKGVMVTKDQMVSANSSAITAPREFDRDAYVKMLQEKRPAFVKLARQEEEEVKKQHQDSSREGRFATDQPPEKKEEGPARIRLGHFQVNWLYLTQKSGGKLLTGEMSWNPVLELLGPFSVRGHFGVFPLRTRIKYAKFWGNEIGVLGVLNVFNTLLLEAGPGFETWVNQGRSGPLVMGNVALKLGDKTFIERIFIGVSLFEKPNQFDGYDRNHVVQYKLGVGFHL